MKGTAIGFTIAALVIGVTIAFGQGAVVPVGGDPFGFQDVWNSVRAAGPVAILLLGALYYCNKERIRERDEKIAAQKESKATTERYRDDALKMQSVMERFDVTAKMFSGAIDRLVDVVDALVEDRKPRE